MRIAVEDGPFTDGAGLELDASSTSVFIFGAGVDGMSDEGEESAGWLLIAAAGAPETGFGVSTL
jgi:hypothetical protein